MHSVLQWIDLIWLPLAWAAVHKSQRWWAIGFLVCCMIMMRLIVEFMESVGYSNGIIGVIPLNERARAVGVYSFFYMAYIIFAHYSKRENWLLMGVSMTIFFMAAITCSIVMTL